MKVSLRQERIYTLELTERELQVLYKGHGNLSDNDWKNYGGLYEDERNVIRGFYNTLDSFLKTPRAND